MKLQLFLFTLLPVFNLLKLLRLPQDFRDYRQFLLAKEEGSLFCDSFCKKRISIATETNIFEFFDMRKHSAFLI
jgi:hypothetical protein